MGWNQTTKRPPSEGRKYKHEWKRPHNRPVERSLITEPGKFFSILDEKLEIAIQSRGGGTHPLWEASRQERVEACRHDLELFGRVYFDNRLEDETPPFHRELFALVERAEETHKPLVIAAPRGHAKSTIISFLLPLHEILYQNKNYILIVSDTYYQATLLVGDIRYELENNNRIRGDFGDQIGNKWTGSQILTKSGIRIAARGTGSQIRGLKHGASRPDLLIADDMENDEQCQTKEQRVKIMNWWNRAVLPAMDPKRGTVVVVGTIIHFDSLLANLLDQKEEKSDKGYIRQVYRTPKADGEPLWPARYDLEKLTELKARIGSLAYNSEYLNIPIDEETQVYKPEWWKWYTKDDLVFDRLKSQWLFRGKPLTIYQGVDPAIGTSAYADYFAHVTIGVTEDKDILVLWAIKDRIDFPTQIRLITEQYLAWAPKNIGIEITVYQRALKQQLLQDGIVPKEVIRGIRPNAGTITDDGQWHGVAYTDPMVKRTVKGLRKLASSKTLRIISRSLLAEQGQVWLREALPEEAGTAMEELDGRRVHSAFTTFYREATEYPRSENDDTLDAFDDALQCVKGFRRTWENIYGDLEGFGVDI
jgi:hypothetical protein